MAVEDFSTYTEYEEVTNWYTVTSAKVACANVQRDEQSWVYKDFGAGYFGDGTDHDVEAKCTAGDAGGVGCFWALANVVTDLDTAYDNYYEYVCAFLYDTTGDQRVDLRNHEGRDLDSTADGLLTEGTKYYYTCQIDDTADQITVEIYSDSGRTTLLDTLVVPMDDGQTYRYCYATASWDSGSTQAITFDVENLDLNEAAAAAVPMLCLLGVGS
jgi:hypothetical protein